MGRRLGFKIPDFMNLRVPLMTAPSIPWADDEYMMVDGFKCVYTPMPETADRPAFLLVHLPGGRSLSLEALREHGCRVILPRKPRSQTLAKKLLGFWCA